MTAPLERALASRSARNASGEQLSSAALGLHCQWCMTTLPAGDALCPACGSAGVPDLRLAASASELVSAPATLAATHRAPALAQPELVEWWRDDDEGDAAPPTTLSLADVERRRTQTFVAIGVAVVSCIALGWLAGPLLAPAIERLTGTTIEHPHDLRGTGAFLGTLVGMFIGATGGWIIWSSK